MKKLIEQIGRIVDGTRGPDGLQGRQRLAEGRGDGMDPGALARLDGAVLDAIMEMDEAIHDGATTTMQALRSAFEGAGCAVADALILLEKYNVDIEPRAARRIELDLLFKFGAPGAILAEEIARKMLGKRWTTVAKIKELHVSYRQTFSRTP